MKKIKLKNYTSEVPVSRSADRIEKFLVEAGARDIQRNYEDGNLVGIHFSMPTEFGLTFFRLPVKEERAAKYLENQRKRRLNVAQRKAIKEQGARTAWRLAQDWIEIQFSMIAKNQLDLTEALLVYAVRGDGKTLYEVMKEGGFKQLMAPKNDDEEIIDAE